MGARTANISRNMYDENKRFASVIHQQGKPLVDADLNDSSDIIRNGLQRLIQKFIGDFCYDDSFKIFGSGLDNDFTITGGDGSNEGAGRILVGGNITFLLDDRRYKENDNVECTPVSTALTETILTDSAGNFTLGGSDDNLVGRALVPDISQPGNTYTITANTQNTITVTGTMVTDGAEANDHYRVELSTPSGADRTDEVYLDVYLDEISGDDDPDIKHTLGMTIETARRKKIIQNVFVAEGVTTPAYYIDYDGNQHYTLKIATIERYDGQDAINIADITDCRRIILGGLSSGSNQTVVVFADSPYTVLETDDILLVDCSGGDIIVNFLPSVNAKKLICKRIDSAPLNKAEYTPDGAETIEGDAASYDSEAPLEFITFIPDGGSAWWVIG